MPSTPIPSVPSPPLTIGIVGLGRAGWAIHLEAIKTDARFRIVAVADPEADRLAEAADLFQCRTFATIEALLAESEAEIVVVATPSAFHAADAAKVLRANRHCVLEKPMALSYAEALELQALEEESECHLFVHHQCLFFDEYLQMKSIFDSGILGPLFHIEFTWASYSRRSDWQTLQKNGGGELNNRFPHILSLVLPFFGTDHIASVTADLRNIKDAGDAEDHAHLFLKTASGLTASLTGTRASAFPFTRWMICGAYGAALSDGISITARSYDSSKVSTLSLSEDAPDRNYGTEELPWVETTREISVPLTNTALYDNVFAVLREGRPLHVTTESAVEVMRVMDLARANSPSDSFLHTDLQLVSAS